MALADTATLVDIARQIGATCAAPAADAVDREARFPREAFAALRTERLLGALIPQELGGIGAPTAEPCTPSGAGGSGGPSLSPDDPSPPSMAAPAMSEHPTSSASTSPTMAAIDEPPGSSAGFAIISNPSTREGFSPRCNRSGI